MSTSPDLIKENLHAVFLEMADQPAVGAETCQIKPTLAATWTCCANGSKTTGNTAWPMN